MKKIKRFFIGNPISNADASSEKLSILWGVSILSSDALSSVAYALQEIMKVLLPVMGAMSFGVITPLTAIILLLIFMVIFSYFKIIGVYSNGGGGYSVVSDNFPRIFALIGGGALLHSYVLTVSVSIVSGVQQLTTLVPSLAPFTTPLVIGFILLITWGNLRGISESAKIFGVLPYLFILFLGAAIVYGLFQTYTGHIQPEVLSSKMLNQGNIPQTLTAGWWAIMLRAFASGCSSLTGIEAISNTVPHFKKPEVKNARIVLWILGGILAFLFVGVTLLAFNLKVHVPIEDESKSLIVLLGQKVFGTSGVGSIFYYGLSISTLIILIMAANTSYSGFPSLSSVMARDGYLPRQLTQKGDRLAFNNGIIILSVLAVFFVVLFNNNITILIAIYAIGVFITFTLSQFAFVKHLWSNKDKYKNAILVSIPSIIGGSATLVVTLILTWVKFFEGAWIALVAISILMVIMISINKHYKDIENKIKLYGNKEANELLKSENSNGLINEVVVAVSSLNSLSIDAINYSKKIAKQNESEEYQKITVLSVATDEESYNKQIQNFEEIFKNTNINYHVIYSEYREITNPISEYIKSRVSEIVKSHSDSTITIVFPQIVERKTWHKVLHAQMINKLNRELRKTPNVILSIMPKSL